MEREKWKKRAKIHIKKKKGNQTHEGLYDTTEKTTKKDKKMEAGHIKFILMDGIGKSFIDKTVTDEELLQAIREILI